jgi:hypothetical protein
MSNRKQTPDILGSVLGGQPSEPTSVPDITAATTAADPPAARTKKQPAPAPKSKPKSAAKPRAKKIAPTPVPVPEQEPDVWEYRVVTFYDYGGYVVRSIGGKELGDWKKRKAPMSGYLNRMGSKGWEMVSMVNTKRYHLLTIFKRRKTS